MDRPDDEEEEDEDGHGSGEEEEEADKEQREAISSDKRQGFWATAMLTQALRKSSQTCHLPMTFTTSLFRQVVIGISKRHLRLGGKKQPRGGPINAVVDKLFSWQAGHTID